MSKIIRPNKLAGNEKAAYEKFKQSCRYGMEAATELATLQNNLDWMKIAQNIGRMLEATRQHEAARKAKNPSGLILPS